jgi:hypothetical protein
MLTLVSALALALVSTPLTSPGGKLDTALDAIRADHISADLHFIASDDLGGRDTPSAGLRTAARFIRARLMRLGFTPGARDGFFYTYELGWLQAKLEECGARLLSAGGGERKWELGSDYYLDRTGDFADQEVSGPVVFGGDGDRGDLEDLALAGSWVLLRDGGRSLRLTARRVREAGAAGLLVAPVEDYRGKSYDQRFARTMTSLMQGRGRHLDPRGERPDAPAASFPTLYLGRLAVADLLGGRSLEELPMGEQLAEEFTERRTLVEPDGRLDVENVCGLWPGSDPELKDEVLIVSAHYDHVGTSRGEIYNGADDNGSGTCGMLALAEALELHGPLRRTVLLMWVSGEEKGLWGSEAWNAAPWLPEGARAVADINIDMIGRNAPDELFVTPTRKLGQAYNGLVRLAESLAQSEGFGPLKSADAYYRRSDHYNFIQAGIPAAFLFADVHADYHKPTDTVEKINFDKIRRVTRLVLRMLDGLQADELDI